MSSSPFCISSFLLITFTFLVIICETIQAKTYGRLLPQEEKNALKEIADQLGKKDWNFDLNPCDDNTTWNIAESNNSKYYNNVNCNCSTPDGFCHVESLYLTDNAFVGPIPEWLKSRDTRYYVIDLSYNKFNQSSAPYTCDGNLNLFRSFDGGNFLEHGKCLSPCSEDKYSVHINCGGGRVTIGDTTYEEDEDSAGAAKFFYKKGNWGASSTGHFWDRNSSEINYKAENVSAIKGDKSQLYMTAHLSPLSLTYFARCLANGSYTLTLHFAEIVYRDNRSFQSLGERIFDVYVQDKLKLKDFDIEREAGGVDKAWEEKFNVTVKDKTVEVRFQYAGKGTTSIPSRGSYGPLVSAISLESNFKPPRTQETSSNWKKKILIVAGAVISSLALILIILYVALRIRRNRKLMEQGSGSTKRREVFGASGPKVRF